jgi:23S rRNA pseudouridine1911/1915/1917 synthase
MIKRKADTVLKVSEPAPLMDFLIAKMGGMARSSVKQLLGQRRVKVGNAIQTRHDFALKAGDVVTVSSGRGNSQLTHPKLKIVYEDDDLIVVNKQPGLLTVAATPGSSETTAFSILRAYVKKQNARAGVYVVHRLDRPVSGVVTFARTGKSLARLNEMFRTKDVHKTYWAIVKDAPKNPEGELVHWLVRNEKQNKSYAYDKEVPNSKKAILHYKVIAHSDNYTLLEIDLKTGRHHQIRCQLAKMGCPIKGDLKYGAKRSNPDGSISLHARRIQFVHPVSKIDIDVVAPVPNDALWHSFSSEM